MQKTPTANTKPFRPWISNLVLSAYGLVSAWMSWHFFYDKGDFSVFLMTFAACCGFSVWQWSNVVRRTHGQRTEARALQSLKKVIERRSGAAMQSSVALHSGGDADAVILLDRTRFNVEIKAIESTKRVTAKHAAQAGRAGAELRSIPVIWLPRAMSGFSAEKNHVAVICGDAQTLLKALESMK